MGFLLSVALTEARVTIVIKSAVTDGTAKSTTEQPSPSVASNTATNRQPFIGKRISDGSHQNRAVIHRHRTALLQHPHQSPTVQWQEHNVQDQYGRQV